MGVSEGRVGRVSESAIRPALLAYTLLVPTGVLHLKGTTRSVPCVTYL